MQARILPTARGWAWLQEGFQLWRKNPALVTFLSFGYLLILVIVSLVPILGQPAAALLMPVLSLGILNGCRAVDEGRKVGPDILFSGFKSNVQQLAVVGGIYFIASLLVLVVTMAADGGALMKVMSGGEQVDEAMVEQSGFGFALLIALLLSTPVLMAYWFAPLLAGWFGQPAPKALFFSLVACARNWRAFLAYGVSLAVFCAILPGLLLGLASAVSPLLVTLLTLPLPILIIPVVFASFYVNARDVFADLPDPL